MSSGQRVFLRAEWRKLIMANYQIDPSILSKYIPAKTELDDWQGNYYVSLVGFMFEKVKLKGMYIPFHTYFPEVNLRFYVKYKQEDEWKRGVVFISEIVPKPAIAWVANNLFKEKYSVCRMNNACTINNKEISVGYKWKKKEWNEIAVIADPAARALGAGSKEEFITEHFWGYSKKNERDTVEYHVEHPRWDIYNINSYTIKCDFADNYGKEFTFLNQREPESIFMAEGSPVKIFDRIMF